MTRWGYRNPQALTLGNSPIFVRILPVPVDAGQTSGGVTTVTVGNYPQPKFMTRRLTPTQGSNPGWRATKGETKHRWRITLKRSA